MSIYLRSFQFRVRYPLVSTIPSLKYLLRSELDPVLPSDPQNSPSVTVPPLRFVSTFSFSVSCPSKTNPSTSHMLKPIAVPKRKSLVDFSRTWNSKSDNIPENNTRKEWHLGTKSSKVDEFDVSVGIK